jgi:mono/diheme cytochrome c family protein
MGAAACSAGAGWLDVMDLRGVHLAEPAPPCFPRESLGKGAEKPERREAVVKNVRWLFPSSPARPFRLALLLAAALGGIVAVACLADLPDNAVTLDQVTRGRLLVAHHGCAWCHNPASYPNHEVTTNDPSDPKWLSGSITPNDSFLQGSYKLYFPNLTPDQETGLGGFSARQIFNALRYGLDPGDTPDVAITAGTPGQGGFPTQPHYLAPFMPWTYFRHMSDGELWDIVAYLQHGIKPVKNEVKASQRPKDYWASYATAKQAGPYPLPPYPAASEEFQPDNTVTPDPVTRGRLLVAHHYCAWCHSPGRNDPSDPNWLSGSLPQQNTFVLDGYKLYMPNLTPDQATGLGQFSARQLFNALRYGLNPADTPDVVITSTTPGQGGFPADPHYLAPFMQWPAIRHMADGELWDIVAYLQHGLKPVKKKIKPSDAPKDHWASYFAPEKTGPYPLLPYPAANEEFQP